MQSRQHLHILLDYLCTHPNASIKYRASNMIIKVHSDGSYLSVQGERSRAAGHFYCRDDIPLLQNGTQQGSMHQECSTINAVASAVKCETATLFLSC